MAIGTVKFFNATKGFGFIIPADGGKDIFVHKAAVELAGLSVLKKGQCLSFEIEPDAGGTKAAKLMPHSEDRGPETKNSPAFSTKERKHQPTIRHRADRETSRDALATIREPDQTRLQRNPKALNRSGEWQRSYERYCDLAQNAVGADAVTREHYWQYAEHFCRIMNGSST